MDQLLILGCGTSLYAGMLGSMYFEKLEAFNLVKVIDASEQNRFEIGSLDLKRRFQVL